MELDDYYKGKPILNCYVGTMDTTRQAEVAEVDTSIGNQPSSRVP